MAALTPLEYSALGLLALGCFFALTGAVGVLRMPDFYSRLHPAGKSDTLAQALILGGLACLCSDYLVALKLGLLCLLLFVTAPTATHAITKAAALDKVKHWTKDGPEPTAAKLKELHQNTGGDDHE